MKRAYAMALCLLLLLSLLAGCRTSAGENDTPETEATKPVEQNTVTVTEIPPEDVEVTVPKEGLTIGAGESDLAIGNVGRIRVDYTGNISSVRYITSADQLPEYPELQGYDEAYFRENALLLVLETVTNGGVEVGIQGIRVDEDRALVQLSHEAQGDLGTAVMTTWLVWAEVAPELNYTWTVSNPAVESQTERS